MEDSGLHTGDIRSRTSALIRERQEALSADIVSQLAELGTDLDPKELQGCGELLLRLFAASVDAGTLDITSVLPASDEGLFLEFVLTGHDTYTLVLIPGGGGTSVEFERTLAGTGWIDRLEFLASAETTAHREAFLNRIAVPEPGAGAALSALGALLLATRRRAR